VGAAWAELETSDAALAAFGRSRIEGRVVYQATLRRDGGPRLHPVSPWIGAGLLVVSCRAHSPKVAEFAADGRYAMHTSQPADDHEGDFGEFMVRGWMERLSPDHPAVIASPYASGLALAFFACSVEEAVATTYEADTPIYRRWRSG
jgi:hypothetical protein